MKDCFFIVWRENGGTPTYKHPTFEAAKAEAMRLCREHGGVFHVLMSLGQVQKIDISWEQHQIEQDIPF